MPEIHENKTSGKWKVTKFKEYLPLKDGTRITICPTDDESDVLIDIIRNRDQPASNRDTLAAPKRRVKQTARMSTGGKAPRMQLQETAKE